MKLPQVVVLALALCLGAGTPATSAAQTSTAKAAKAKSAKKTKARKGGKKKAPVAAVPAIDYDGEQVNFAEWGAVATFADDVALRHGFARSELTELIGKMRYIEAAVQLVKPAPPGKPKNWAAYRALTVEPIRIGAGVNFWNEHAATLARAESEFGVPAEIIAGIIGVETVYGRDTGKFRVLDVLTTLAFAYPDTPNRVARMAFFRNELENTLLLARQNRVDPFSLLGSFAGAIGMPQFMPGSVLAYGVDYDRDGVIDLRNSAIDAIGSVANFLVQHGWQRQHPGPLVYPAQVSDKHEWAQFIDQGLSARFTEEELREGGVASEVPLPKGMLFGLVDLQNGSEPTEYWYGNDNFFAITQYNRSYFYAMAVIELGRAVKAARTEATIQARSAD